MRSCFPTRPICASTSRCPPSPARMPGTGRRMRSRPTGRAGPARSRPSTRTRCGGSSRCRRTWCPRGKAATPTCAGSMGPPTSARGRPGCARGWACPGSGRRSHSCGRPPSRRRRCTRPAAASPPAWFVPFAPDERWLVLGAGGDPGDGGRATATPTRTLIYATTMARARRRVRRALGAFRRAGVPQAPGLADDAAPRVVAELEQIGCWLEEFHRDALVELDYGGLVHLLDDGALRADQSVAEVSAVVSALISGEPEMAIAMYGRVTRRWRALAALERAS